MRDIKEVAEFLRGHDNYLILTHKSPDGDTLGSAAALCHILRGIGKIAWLLKNDEVVPFYASYVEGLWAAEDYAFDTVVSVDLAALGLFPKNAEHLRDRVELAIDHHPTYEGFGKNSFVRTECAACGEIIYELAVELGQLTKKAALPLYVAVATDTGCFVYSNVTANTHRVAAALIDTGIDFRAANKLHFRTKTKKRIALESRLMSEMEFFDKGRIVIVQLPLSLQRELELTENDTDDLAALGGQVEGTDCSVTMKQREGGEWKLSVRTGARVNAAAVCARFGGGGHKAASGCTIYGMTQQEVKDAIVRAVMEEVGDA
ncbi:MAG: bifunctional oligoribonuclease/PAP phosphatase NrnA [Oscillospiraceae bacterium]|nr:bifunctional oligoribonuclease/PAP phosphatase NrnA [Oscillospiraceae bacterium]